MRQVDIEESDESAIPFVRYAHSRDEFLVSIFSIAVFRYCQAVRGSVTSWIRTEARNAFVGGKKKSLHLEGLAVDVVCELLEDDPDKRAKLARGFGLQLIVEGNHDHLQMRIPS